jgi:hypothetical protein
MQDCWRVCFAAGRTLKDIQEEEAARGAIEEAARHAALAAAAAAAPALVPSGPQQPLNVWAAKLAAPSAGEPQASCITLLWCCAVQALLLLAGTWSGVPRPCSLHWSTHWGMLEHALEHALGHALERALGHGLGHVSFLVL